ncbi:Hydantoinase/oxoprolinase N-terminal region-domain-containing protein [Phyllosticta citrichinensis]|uniref:Hydantoinase/oxoprolinase N-terminal region-domain-containing protein n=1 Tax=Phyllosticta citrichinensis TaxID=1130410 RepID=A0ABR1XY19_9PEZI
MAIDKVFRVGVDVDPGESDAEHRGIRSTFKCPTTPDVTSGIINAIEGALSKCDVKRDSICAVIIGTTHFVNAVVQADDRNLRKVAVLRVCGPYTQENPSFLDFPPILARIMNGHTAYLDGGLEYDGREILPIDEEHVRNECKIVKEKGIDDIAVIGVFSPLDTEGTQEARVRQIVLEELPDADVVLSRDIGQLGYLERENATILNTSILKYARRTIRGFKLAMSSLGLSCALFLTQNDGTVIDADTVEGSDRRIRWRARHTANIENGREKFPNPQVIVADIGGTSTDACAL